MCGAFLLTKYRLIFIIYYKIKKTPKEKREMTEIEIINYVDRYGSVENAFHNGLRPDAADAGALRPILEDAYSAMRKLEDCISTFYDYAENCSFEE